MEQQKLTNQKEALLFLSKQYPKCFFLEGKVQPLKIGIFQDLAKELDGSELISKRLLRMSLRHYTSSWKYLASVQTGAARIDLQGESGDLVEKQHAEHASQQLEESKAKAAKVREQKAKERRDARKLQSENTASSKNAESASSAEKGKVDITATRTKPNNKPPHKTRKYSSRPNSHNTNNQRQQAQKRPEPPKIDKNLAQEELVLGKTALVKLGKEPMPVTITDIGKDGVSVQLKSGMTVKVQATQLYTPLKEG